MVLEVSLNNVTSFSGLQYTRLQISEFSKLKLFLSSVQHYYSVRLSACLHCKHIFPLNVGSLHECRLARKKHGKCVHYFFSLKSL